MVLKQTLRPKNRFFISSPRDYFQNPKGIIPSWMLPEHVVLLHPVPFPGGYEDCHRREMGTEEWCP